MGMGITENIWTGSVLDKDGQNLSYIAALDRTRIELSV